MGKLILVCGHLAALKTTLSKRLGNDLDLVCLNKDDLKEILGDTIGFSNREENLKLSRATFELMKSFAQKMLERNQSVILESNFKAHEFQALAQISDLSRHHSLTLFLTGDPLILYERYVKRQGDRHHVHTSAGLISYEAFEASMESVHEYALPGPFITIDTSEFDDGKYQALLDTVMSFLNS